MTETGTPYYRKLVLVIVLAIVFWLGAQLIGRLIGSGISNFDECVAAGEPIMESVPRQCRSGNQVFVEDLDIIKL